MIIDSVSAARQVTGPLHGNVLQDVAEVENFEKLVAQVEAATVPAAGVGVLNQFPVDGKTVEVQPFAPALESVKAGTISESYWDGLRSLQSSSEKFNSVAAAAARDAIDGTGLSTGRLVELQLAVMNYSLEAEVMAKITDRVSQGIQTLFRNQ